MTASLGDRSSPRQRQARGRLQRYAVVVDPDRALHLLAGERARIEQALAGLRRDAPGESDTETEPGERGSGSLYQDEFDEGLSEDLAGQLAGVERAEARLKAGTYGLSIESGEAIPDGRLEAIPTAERTVQEEESRPSG